MSLLSEQHKPASPSKGGGKSGSEIKWVSCVIRPERLQPVQEALDRLNLVGGMTVTDVRGFGRQKGQVEHYRGGTVQVRFLDKVRLDLVVSGQDAEEVEGVIRKHAGTGNLGDGKIFVYDVWNALRIRTGERGADAL